MHIWIIKEKGKKKAGTLSQHWLLHIFRKTLKVPQ
jgi:hypothetical protein